jgi:uncharacterized protein YdaT
MEEKIYELCEIESMLYLDYYNGEYSYDSFKGLLKENKPKIRNLVYDLLDEGYEEKDIISSIKRQGEFYKKSPEWFGKNDNSSNYPSEYYETKKNKKYPSHENCGSTLSLVKRFFATRKARKAEYAYQESEYEHLDDGIREMIYTHMKAMENKKNKSKRKKSKRNKSKRKKSKR